MNAFCRLSVLNTVFSQESKLEKRKCYEENKENIFTVVYCLYQNVSGSSQFKPVIQGSTVYQWLTEKVIILGTYNIFKIKELTVTLCYKIKLQHELYKLLLRTKNLRNKIDLDSKPNSTSYFVILNKLLQFLCLSFLF